MTSIVSLEPCLNSSKTNNGGGAGTRTRNLVFRKHLLCPLSYASIDYSENELFIKPSEANDILD